MRTVYCIFNYDGYHSYIENIYSSMALAKRAQAALRANDSWDDWIIKPMSLLDTYDHIPDAPVDIW